MKRCGKHPIELPHELAGFVWNRLQFAVLREALSLVQLGIADAATVDLVIEKGTRATVERYGCGQSIARRRFLNRYVFSMTEQESHTGPLSGLRVVDAGNMIAAPMAAGLLADYGADVVKIEHPESGDPLRGWEPHRDGVPLWWKVTNRGKSLITLNLSRQEGQDLFRGLIREADVLIESFRPGTLERWGLGPDVLAQINPRLVLLRVSGFGQTGPFRQKPGYGTVAEAMSGVAAFTGFPEGPPTLPGFPLADSVAAVFGALAIVSAIYHRDIRANGLGQEIDLSLYEPLFRLVESQVIGYDQLGLIKKRSGNRLEEDAPRNAYQSKDGEWIALSASSDRTWARLAEAIGRPELATDRRFESSRARVKNVEDLDVILGDWFGNHDRTQAMEILDAHDVVAGPVLDIASIFLHDQYRARESIVVIPDDDFGTVRMPAPVPRFSRTPARVLFAGRDKGADNNRIYKERLGLSDDEVEQYRRTGVI